MPDFIGKHLDEARTFLRRYLYFSINVEYEYSEIVAKDLIISQSIAPGEGFNHRFRMNVVVSLGKQAPIVIEEPSSEPIEDILEEA